MFSVGLTVRPFSLPSFCRGRSGQFSTLSLSVSTETENWILKIRLKAAFNPILGSGGTKSFLIWVLQSLGVPETSLSSDTSCKFGDNQDHFHVGRKDS